MPHLQKQRKARRSVLNHATVLRWNGRGVRVALAIPWRVLDAASPSGSAIELYGFFIYITLAALVFDEHGYRIQLGCVDYDREAVIKAIEQSRHPTPSFLKGFMRGERVPSSDPGFFQAGRRAENQKEQ